MSNERPNAADNIHPSERIRADIDIDETADIARRRRHFPNPMNERMDRLEE